MIAEQKKLIERKVEEIKNLKMREFESYENGIEGFIHLQKLDWQEVCTMRIYQFLKSIEKAWRKFNQGKSWWQRYGKRILIFIEAGVVIISKLIV